MGWATVPSDAAICHDPISTAPAPHFPRPQQPSSPRHNPGAGAYRPTDFFETSAMLITFILLGKYLEAAAKGRTSDAITKLMQLTPATAILLEASCTSLLTAAPGHAADASHPRHSPGDRQHAPKLYARPSLSSSSSSQLMGASLLQAGSGCWVGQDVHPLCLSMW